MEKNEKHKKEWEKKKNDLKIQGKWENTKKGKKPEKEKKDLRQIRKDEFRK